MLPPPAPRFLTSTSQILVSPSFSSVPCAVWSSLASGRTSAPSSGSPVRPRPRWSGCGHCSPLPACVSPLRGTSGLGISGLPFQFYYVILKTFRQRFLLHSCLAFDHLLLFLKPLQEVRKDFSMEFRSAVSCSSSFRTFWTLALPSSFFLSLHRLVPNPLRLIYDQLHLQVLPMKLLTRALQQQVLILYRFYCQFCVVLLVLRPIHNGPGGQNGSPGPRTQRVGPAQELPELSRNQVPPIWLQTAWRKTLLRGAPGLSQGGGHLPRSLCLPQPVELEIQGMFSQGPLLKWKAPTTPDNVRWSQCLEPQLGPRMLLVQIQGRL